MPKYGRNFLVKLSLRETLKEIAAGVFEYAGLNDEHAGDICLYYFHRLIIEIFQDSFSWFPTALNQ